MFQRTDKSVERLALLRQIKGDIVRRALCIGALVQDPVVSVIRPFLEICPITAVGIGSQECSEGAEIAEVAGERGRQLAHGAVLGSSFVSGVL